MTATTTSLTASSSTIASGASVTLAATVSPLAASGTVAFYDGTGSLGAGTLNSGAANLTTSSLTTAGTHSITAVYGGSAAYAGSTSSALSITVTAAPSFTIAASASTLSIVQGASGSDTVTVTDVNGFTGNVTLAASGLPAGVTASFGSNPTTGSSAVTFTSSSTATAGTSTVTITGNSGSLTASTTIALTVSGGSSSSDGIPLPSSGIALQGVTAGPITILNWAGFKAAESWTFDDSQPSQIEHYADIQTVGVPVTYYITTGQHLDLPNYDATWTEAANAGDELGNHTQDHCQANLTNCATNTNTGNLATELDNATSYILAHYPQKAVWTGASPYGDTGYDADASTRFSVYRGVQGGSMLPNDNTDPFNLPSHVAAQGETAAQFNAVTDAARSGGAWQIFVIHTITPTTAIWYNPVAVTDVTGAMTYANTTGDTWVDSVVDIAAYWRGLKTLASVTPVTSGATTIWTWALPANFPTGKYLRVIVPGGGALSQNGAPIAENPAGFFAVALDAGSLTLVQ